MCVFTLVFGLCVSLKSQPCDPLIHRLWLGSQLPELLPRCCGDPRWRQLPGTCRWSVTKKTQTRCLMKDHSHDGATKLRLYTWKKSAVCCQLFQNAAKF